ncbi:MAG: GAF domain-containing protein [Anaerolineales bacterium]|uniref:HD domain-containing phosphohydrolase n=1 Tax=Candidatus Villigracilis vicinus TaxID=3140679 RepID=UPI00313731E2|nr:GAF domain-containing protein [Anaerolineales bacterium]
MKSLAEKNFFIFISLLLEGIGAGLVIIPGHFGIADHVFPSWFIGLWGISCFIMALLIQVASIWKISAERDLKIKIAAIIFLFLAGCILIVNRQWIGAFAFLITAITQVYLLLPVNEHLKQLDFTQFTVTLITFAAGLSLTIAASDIAYMSLLAAVFLISAFMGIISVIVPGFKYGRYFNKAQVIPWIALIFFYIIPTDKDNGVTPAAVLAILLFGTLIPWERLLLTHEDVLSRRMVLISCVIEVSHLIFLGALLSSTNPDFLTGHGSILSIREATLIFFVLFSSMVYMGAATVIMTTSSLILELNRTGGEPVEEMELDSNRWVNRLEKYIKPFIMTQEGVRGRVQADQINTLARLSAVEKKRNAQLTLLLELSQQLENQLDPPVSAQLAVNTLERALNCGLAALYIHEPEEKEFMLLAAAGRQTHIIPTGYRQNAIKGVLGRCLRQCKTQIVNDIRVDPEYIHFEGETSLSAAIIPLIFNGHVHGMISLNNDKPNAFGSLEIGLAEMVAAELTRAWERSGYHQRLTELIQTGSRLSSVPDPEAAAQEVASISRDIVQAKFTYLYIQLGQERNFTQHASSGRSPLLLDSLIDTSRSGELIKMALHASQPFRIRDVRKYDKTANLELDNTGVRSLLTIPIRWHQVNIGAIFAFGKQNEVFFTENDESLAELISIQAGGAFESTWLQQELRSSLRITSLLYRLSNQIIQSENIEEAASDIAQTAHKLGKNITTGIVLFDTSDSLIAEVRVDDEGKNPPTDHPMSLIRDAMNSGQMIYFSLGQSVLRTCLPIQTPIRKYGAIWMDTMDDPSKPIANPNDLQALVNQAAIALERSLLLVESRRQAKEIKAAYDTLEATYDQTLASLTSALDARDSETEGHSSRVTYLAVKLGEFLGYSPDQLKILERGSLLHDIGKIGISDTILHKPGALTADEWKVMQLHPDIGARIVEGIPFLQDTIPLIQRHQERWDGSGYPGGLSGDEIPELARLFALIDAFDALTSNRPYRQKITKKEALQYIKDMSGTHFDPTMVKAFEALLQKEPGLLSESSE